MKAGAMPWWARPSVSALLILLASAPMWMVQWPPLIDYPGHIGRYHIQLELAQSPLLQRNWDFRWGVIGNLGVDLLIMPLGKLLGLQRAAWTIAALIGPLTIWGMVRVSRAAHGRVVGPALAAMPLAMAYPFHYGFVNFCLGQALALHAFAWWLHLGGSPRSRRWRAGIFVPVSSVIWLCHAFAWGILGLLAGAAEFARHWQVKDRRPPGRLASAILACVPLMPPVVLMLLWRMNTAEVETDGWFFWQMKLVGFVQIFRDQSRILDIVTLSLAIFLLWFAARSQNFRFDAGLGLAATFFLVTTLLLPFRLFGSAFADWRLWPITLACALLAVAPRQPGLRAERVIALLAIVVFVVRIGADIVGFREYDRAYTRHLRALQSLPAGAKIAVFTRIDCPSDWRMSRLDHVDSIAIVKRDAFTNSQWEVPGAQLLKPIGALGTSFNADPSHLFFDASFCKRDKLGPDIARQMANVPPAMFGYVWLMNAPPRQVPVHRSLRQLYADENSALYRLAEAPAR